METVDYDYQISSYHSFGEFVLLKEFFTSGLCTTDADEGKGDEVRLPKYSRDNFQYKDKGKGWSLEFLFCLNCALSSILNISVNSPSNSNIRDSFEICLT